MHPTAAATAFFALGVTVFGTLLLLLFNPRSASVRWFAAFQAAVATWLAAQGWAFGMGSWAQAGPVVSAAVHLMPGMFLAFALSERGRLAPWGAVALALALLPVDLASVGRQHAEWLLLAWNLGAWGTATVLVVRHFGASRTDRRQRRLGYVLLAGLLVIFPIGVATGTMDRNAMAVYGMPLLMVWVQVLVFIGVARLRFYDIEVRAARTGELAAAATERDRLAVVGELAASLAHEIRNPLTGVRSLAQRLADDEVDEARRRRYAGVILEETARVERLVANLLGMTRRSTPRDASAPTPLQPLFDDLSLLLQGRCERTGVRLSTEAARLSVAAGREPLAQALLNLLLNAVRHSPPGGQVSLTAQRVQDGVRLAVRDQGAGVPPAERERIWEPFHSGGSGTGLGLAVVRRLAEEEGWRAELADAPGGGAEFRLRVPEAVRPEPVEAPPAVGVPSP